MGKKYVSAPIIEALCEFQLPPDSKWDLTVPGLVYEKVSDEFPDKDQRLVQQQVGLAQTPEGLQQQIRTSERILLFSHDQKAFIQLGPHVMAVNCLKPYPSWEEFRGWIEKAFAALAETVNIETFQRIGLRYINRIEIPGPSVDLDAYFEFRPFLGKNLPQNIANFIVGCVLPFSDGRDCCKVQLTNAVAEGPDERAFLLDLDYFLVEPQAVARDGAMEWVESAHEEVEKLFEGCMSPRLRECFQEIK